ncbi:MAG: acyl-ACP--UDP-N-acetylglucosamine O-acyltransferase [Candidatus Omnitrophota bacterium]
MKIHPTALIDKKAKLADDIEVGPYAIIGPDVVIGRSARIGPHVVINGNTTIGDNCSVFTGAVVGSAPQDLKYKGKRTFLKIGDNNIIREYTTLNPGTEEGHSTSLGDDNLLMAYSHVAHDCKVGNNCIIANAGTLAGHVTLEDKVVLGGLAAIHQFVRVGKLSIIGGCSKIVRDIPPFSTCDGHPARVYGLNLIGIRRSGMSREAQIELRKAFKILFHSKLSFRHAAEKVKEELKEFEEIRYLLEFIKGSERGVTRGAE